MTIPPTSAIEPLKAFPISSAANPRFARAFARYPRDDFAAGFRVLHFVTVFVRYRVFAPPLFFELPFFLPRFFPFLGFSSAIFTAFRVPFFLHGFRGLRGLVGLTP
jgi:hypothetical protein